TKEPSNGATDHETEAKRLAREEMNRPFDLSTGPLVRVKLVRMSEQEHLIMVNMHHIISDEWSMKIFFRELSELYQGFAQGRSAILQDLPINYTDFATWQREWLQGEVLQKQLDFWRERLSGNPPLM